MLLRACFLILLVTACILAPLARAQTPDDDLKQGLTGGFIYGISLGENSYRLNNSPGFSLVYSYRPLRWLALEAGLDQVVHPIGFVGGKFSFSANDQLYLVPFGVRLVWGPARGRVRLTAGGGGAYLNHNFGTEALDQGLTDAAGWGRTAVASADYALTRSGRLRAGLTGRYYYVKVASQVTARIFTIGPEFTFSFR